MATPIDPINLKGTEVYDILEEEWGLPITMAIAEELEIAAGYCDRYDIQLYYTANGVLQINIDTEYLFLTMEVEPDGGMDVYVGRNDYIMQQTRDWFDDIAVIVKYFYLFCFNDIDIFDD